MVDRVGQNAIQALAVGGIRETGPVVSANPAVKWHPSHWVNTASASGVAVRGSSIGSLGSGSLNLAKIIEELASVPAAKAVQMTLYWGAAETAKNQYIFDQPNNLIDQVLQVCGTWGVRLYITFWDHTFSASQPQTQVNLGRFPQYLLDEGLLYFDSATPELILKRWEPTFKATDRLIALHQAFAAKYDGHPLLEAALTSETSCTTADSATVGSTTFNDRHLAHWLRLIPALRAAFQRTRVIVEANSGFSGSTRQAQLLAAMHANRMEIGGPDIRPEDFPGPYPSGQSTNLLGTQFQRLYYGLDGATVGTVVQRIDYRGKMANAFEIQSPNLGGKDTPAGIAPSAICPHIQSVAVNTFRGSGNGYLYKTFNVDDPANDANWSAHIKPFLLTNPPINSTPPQNYGGNVFTG
jgi:hypothetical protein